MDIPKFYLWRELTNTLWRRDILQERSCESACKQLLERKRMDNDDSNPYVFEVVDGQQRIRTVMKFMGVVPPNDNCYEGLTGCNPSRHY